MLGYFKPRLSVNWENFKIINKATGETKVLGNQFKISLYQALKVRQIKNTPFTTHIVVNDRGTMVNIYHDFENTGNTSDITTTSLYPRLTY